MKGGPLDEEEMRLLRSVRGLGHGGLFRHMFVKVSDNLDVNRPSGSVVSSARQSTIGSPLLYSRQQKIPSAAEKHSGHITQSSI